MASFFKIFVYSVILAVVLYFTKQYFSGGTCSSTERMDNKVVIVTGSNTGIGKYTVQDLVTRGAKVYMACRTLKKAEAAADDIRKEAGVPKDQIVVMQLDLSSYESIRNFAKDFKKRESRLDVLINNAGVMWIPERTLTVDGNEMTFGTNHLGHFLLTNLLLDTLIASAPSRVVTVSSMGHTLNGPLNMDDLNWEKEYEVIASYSHSKLANIMFSRELGKRMQGTGVTTYAVHPGGIITELARHLPMYGNKIYSVLIEGFAYFFFKSIPQGAQTQICCSVDPELAEETMLYYSDCEVKAPLPVAEDDALCKELWDRSVAMVNLKPEELNKLVRG